jgi:hypothetical protein
MIKKTAILLLTLAFMAIINPSFSQYGDSDRADSILRNKEANLPAWTLNFNVVDAALYGPIIQMEFKISNRGYLVPWLRYSFAGAVSQYNWTNFEDDAKMDPVSTALALGFKKFIPGDKNLQHIFWGFFGEFIYEKGMKNTGSDYEFEQTRTAVAAYLNIGYRWKSQRNFYWSLGILPGYYYDLKNEGTYTNSGGPYPEEFKNHNLTGMIDFSFGWNFEE